MKCNKCGADDCNDYIYPGVEGNECFETLEYWCSKSNWDDDDFYAKYKCKTCGDIIKVSQ